MIGIISCASPRPSPTLGGARGERVSAALDLLASIPGRASECTLTRPTLIDDARRSLLARLRSRDRAGALGYGLRRGAISLRVTAYASCVAHEGGRARRITRVRFSGDISAEARDDLLASLPFATRWAEEPCRSDPAPLSPLSSARPALPRCSLRAVSLVAPDVVEIDDAAGDRAARAGVDDVRAIVRAELAARPGILEMSVVPIGTTGLLAIELLERAPRGVALARRLRATSREAASIAYGPELEEALAAIGYDERGMGFRVRGEVFERYQPLPWSMVETLVADEDLESEFRVRRAQRDRVLPISVLDMNAPEALRRQAGARALASRVSRDLDRGRAMAAERALLLERVFELTGDVGAALEAIGLRGELGDPRAAHELAGHVLDVAPDDPSAREAFVSTAADAATLVVALERLRPELPVRDRAILAEVAVRARESGIGFSTVEASDEVRRAVAPAALSPTRDVEVPIDALVEAAYLLLRSESPEVPVSSLAVRAEGSLREGAPPGHDGVAVRWGASTWASVERASPTLEGLRGLSSALRAQLPATGEVTLSAWIEDALHASRSITIRVALDGPRARLRRASIALESDVWSALARDVLRPVMSVEATRFPPPTLRMQLGDPARAAVLARFGVPRSEAPLSCEAVGPELACVSAAGPEPLLDVLATIAHVCSRGRAAPPPLRGAPTRSTR